MIELNNITSTYAKGVKTALQVLRETEKKADLFWFDVQSPLLPQIEQAISSVNNADYTKYIEYLKVIQNEALLRLLTKAHTSKLTQAQANFTSYLYLLVCDSRIMGEYLKSDKTSYNEEERQSLMYNRMKKIGQLWQILEARAKVLSDNYNNMPSTPVTRLMHQTMKLGLNIEDIKPRKRLYTHSYKYNIAGKTANDKQIVTITETTGKSTTTITIDDIGKLAGNNKSLKQFFAFMLIKLHEQVFSDDGLRKGFIEFSLDELVSDKKMYKSIMSARKGVNNNWLAMKTFSLGECSIEISKKKKIINDKDCVLFITKNIKNNICKITINQEANWDVVKYFYTVVPDYCLSLSNRAFDLAMMVFNGIRLNATQLNEHGYFDISNRQLQADLCLPSEIGCINPNRDIKAPIENSICEIEDRQAELLNYNDIRFERIGNENAKTGEYLNEGVLRVHVSGSLLERVCGIAENKAKRIKKAEKIIEKAKIKALAKHVDKVN